jgi:hypothetical protein
VKNYVSARGAAQAAGDTRVGGAHRASYWEFKEPTVADMVLVMCILMSAYFIRGITGFGSGLISVPLLALSQPLQFAIPLVLALDFTGARSRSCCRPA